MAKKYIIDASILIKAFSKNDKECLITLNNIRKKGELYIPSIIFTELRIGLTDKQATSLIPILKEAAAVISVNYEHSIKAGQILRKYKDNGISFADGIIAGLTIIEGGSLVTLDRNFSVIKELQTYTLL